MSLVTEALKQLLRLKGTLEELPVQLDQILMDVSTGRLHVNVSSPQAEGLVPAIRELGGLLALGMVAAASIIAAALLVIPHFGDTVLYGVPVLPVLAVVITVWAGVLMTAVIGWAALRGRDLRIRLASWIPLLSRSAENRRSRKERRNRGPGARRAQGS